MRIFLTRNFQSSSYSQFSQRSRFGSTEPPSSASKAANQRPTWVPASPERLQALPLIGLFWCPTRWLRRPESRPLAELTIGTKNSRHLSTIHTGHKPTSFSSCGRTATPGRCLYPRSTTNRSSRSNWTLSCWTSPTPLPCLGSRRWCPPRPPTAVLSPKTQKPS